MKKLLSTLSIIGITGTGASNGLIGSLNTTHITNNNVSEAIDLDISAFTLKSNDNIYDTIRYQLAKAGNTDSYSIKYDSKIKLEIHFGSLLLPENTLAQYGTTYKVTVTVADGDLYFNKTTKEVDIEVGLEKTTLDITTFTLTNGDDLYADLENDALAQAPNGVSLADIQGDHEMFIEAFEGSSTVKLLPKDTKVQAGTSYTVESAVSSKDKFFNELDQTSYTITQASDLVDITKKSFTDVNESETNTIGLLVNAVRTQIGSWADPAVTASDIKNSQSTLFSIWNIKNGNQIDTQDGNTPIEFPRPFSVKIDILSGDPYFIKTESTFNTIITIVHD